MGHQIDTSGTELRRCLADFSLQAEDSDIRPLTGGLDNLNLLLDARGERFVLRRYDRTDPAEVTFEIELIQHLRERGFPTPQPRPTRTGQFLSELDSRPVAVFAFHEGRPGQPDSMEDAAAVAVLLARLHVLTVDFTAPCHRWRTDQNRIETLRKTCTSSGKPRPAIARFLDLAQTLIHRVAQKTSAASGIPVGVVHHDPNPTNVVFDDSGRIVALLDFDESHIAPLITDLASLCHYWAPSDASPGIDVDRTAELVDRYCEHRLLSPSERLLLPDHIRLFYAADAAEFFSRELEEAPDADIDIKLCHSYQHLIQLLRETAWERRLATA